MIGPPSEMPNLLFLVPCVADEWHVRTEALVGAVAKHTSVQLVGAAPGDDVDARAGEAPMPHVERREQDLILFHGVQRYDFAAIQLTCREIARRHLIADAVDADAVHTCSRARRCQREPRRHLRNQPDEVVQVTIDDRHLVDHRIRQERLCACVRTRKHPIRRRLRFDLLEASPVAARTSHPPATVARG